MGLKIGFDAKRVFLNRSGLGNYSRSSVNLLSEYYPGDSHYLFTPTSKNPMELTFGEQTRIVYPETGLYRKFPALWRSYGMTAGIRCCGLDIYHGLSAELPVGIRNAGCRSVVTIHDLIFVRFPELFTAADRFFCNKKYRRSCDDADRIIAISKQTKDDLVQLWNIDPQKIDIVYQGCNSIFYNNISEKEKAVVRKKYLLPEEYILSVGTLEERKNLMLTLEAMVAGKIDVPLVACGRHTPYADKLREYAVRHGISDRVFFHHNVYFNDLPAIYQMARAAVYVSVYEGFGIPIIEALNSGTPMITTRGGVFPETGGDACIYVDPHDTEEMAEALKTALYDEEARKDMIEKGDLYVRRFRDEEVVRNLHAVYEKLMI